MTLTQFLLFSHAVASLLFVVLAGFFVRPWKDGIYSPLFTLASLMTACWHISYILNGTPGVAATTQVLSALHSAGWIAALLATLSLHIDQQQSRHWFIPLYGLLTVLLLAGAVATPYLLSEQRFEPGLRLLNWTNLLFATLGVIVVEQVLRNTLHRQRQAVLFLCLGVAVLFIFDIIVYSNALLFQNDTHALAAYRPLLNILAASSLIFASTRSLHSSRVSLSRKMVFYSASLVIAGAFLVTMAAIAWYVKAAGGGLATMLQLGLLLAAAVAMLVAFGAPRWRAALRVFVNKHFFLHKYDYRTEWLNLINRLSQPTLDRDAKTIAMDAACTVFHADNAHIWLLRDNEFVHVASTQAADTRHPAVPANSKMCEKLAADWVFHPSGRAGPSARHNNLLPDWIDDIAAVWIIAPLLSQQRLSGFICLTKTENAGTITWEDLDVLKTVGRQLGNYLALHVAADQLAQSRQFDAYNKLTAFIMHDLKNLIAQQALVVENAKKHKENPAFVEDAIKTIENSVTRMSSLLSKMQQRGPSASRSVDLSRILLDSVNKCRDKKPAPSLRMPEQLFQVNGDHDHLVMIFAHIIKNAQEATPASGFVDVFVELQASRVVVTVEDNGQGMSDEFLRERLFKPFDTTKSGQGMGIGVYQTREYIRNLGGEIEVNSTVNEGTTFTISMPVAIESALKETAHGR